MAMPVPKEGSVIPPTLVRDVGNMPADQTVRKMILKIVRKKKEQGVLYIEGQDLSGVINIFLDEKNKDPEV